jgi:hypothetical protein
MDGAYNSSVAYKYLSRNGTNFLPWAMKTTYNGTNAGFDWSSYPGGSNWRFAGPTMQRTNSLWPAFLGYRGGTQPASNGGGSSDGILALQFARKQLGDPYVADSDGPDSWDCSGLTAAAYNEGVPNGYKKYGLISYSTSQADRLKVASRRASGSPGDGGMPNIPNNFGIGDILYFTNTGLGASGKHVSMYAGSNKIIEAGNPVQINDLNNDFNRRYFNFGGPPIARFAAGGFVGGMGGPRSDMVPALLSNGEYVMKSNAVDKYGRGFMDQINSGNFNMPSFGMPSMPTAPSSSIATTVNGGTSSTNNSSSNVKIVINGASGKSATAIANKVASMINSSNNRRNHSRSI